MTAPPLKYCLLLLLLFSCAPQAKKAAEAVPADERHYSMPDVPSTLREPAARAEYAVTHYWERFDFNDPSLAQDSIYMEQAFVDYAAILPLAHESIASASIRQLLRQTEKTAAGSRLMYLAKHYLGHPESPIRNEAVYVLFLKEYAALPSTPLAERERADYMAAQLSKNNVGTMAADFSYTDRNGRHGSLYQTESELTLLFFYNPDCENCHRLLTAISQNGLPIGTDRLTVLAVYGDNDTSLWQSSRQPIPDGWIDVIGPEITSNQLYYIPATPSLYLLDKDKHVLLKDAQPDVLVQKLTELQ